jgi:hypothetical protein
VGKLVTGIIMIVISLLMFGIVLDSISTLLAWTSGGLTLEDFTGLQAIVSIAPLLIFLGLMTAGGWLTISGLKGEFGSGGGGGGGRSRGLH